MIKCYPIISRIITLLPNLLSFSWYSTQNLPTTILEALRNVRTLNIQLYNSQRANLSMSCLKQLEQDSRIQTSLLELSADNFQNDASEPGAKNIALARAMIEAPSLQTLSVRLSPTYLPASPGDYTQGNWLQPSTSSFQQPQWDQGRKSSLQCLQALRICGPNLKIRGSVIDLRQGILSTIPCSHLRVLELWNCGDCGKIFDSLNETTTSLQLRVFSIRDDPSEDAPHWLTTDVGIRACEKFMIGLNNLEELALEGYGGLDMACITKHYRTLRKLTWISRCILSWDKTIALQTISTQCLHIISLKINDYVLCAQIVSDLLYYCNFFAKMSVRARESQTYPVLSLLCVISRS